MSNISEFNFLSLKGSSMRSDSASDELQRRLSLYQLFVKLYEHHGNLFEKILELENISESSLKVKQSYYIQAVIDNDVIYVVTNLGNGKSQSFLQSQHIWTIGRDRNSGIYLNNKYISRRHAAIRYIEQEFYLIDFNSTNGTYINGEQIYHPTKLKDGDIIGLGNLTFPFFINQNCIKLPTVAVELLMELVPGKSDENTEKLADYQSKTQKSVNSKYIFEVDLIDEISPIKPFEEELSQEWKSSILDRFYSKEAP